MKENIAKMMLFTEMLKDEPEKTFDFISAEYRNFKKEDLANIIKELLCSLHYHLDNSYGKTLYNQIVGDVQIQLDEQYEDAYEEYNKEFEKWEKSILNKKE